jgi:2'-5' RNA ligase
MAISAFLVRVSKAEACVGSLRARFDATTSLGVPAHITVLAPFMSRERITDAVLREARAAIAESRSFEFTLARVARFPTTTYLAPEPPEPFVRLTEALVRRFPTFPPFAGEFQTIIPHLTVAHGSAAEAEIAATELGLTMQRHGPIRSICKAVVLLENSSGRWNEMHTFALAAKNG